jgi:hypothetical protein
MPLAQTIAFVFIEFFSLLFYNSVNAQELYLKSVMKKV